MFNNLVILTHVVLVSRVKSFGIIESTRDVSGKESLLGKVFRAVEEKDKIR